MRDDAANADAGVNLIAKLGILLCGAACAVVYFSEWHNEAGAMVFGVGLLGLLASALSR